MDDIDLGDKVTVIFSEYMKDYCGIVLYKPIDAGDMWYIKTKNEIIALNPSCNILVGIFKEIKNET
jgi:hypothetical protein